MTQKPLLVTENQLIGHLAQWAVRQHPYHKPEGLFELVDFLTQQTADWEIKFPDLNMRYFENSRALDVWLTEVLAGHPVMQQWNTPRSQKHTEYVFVSQFDRPIKEDDFIDTSAMICNIAHSIWKESVQEDRLYTES